MSTLNVNKIKQIATDIQKINLNELFRINRSTEKTNLDQASIYFSNISNICRDIDKSLTDNLLTPDKVLMEIETSLQKAWDFSKDINAYKNTAEKTPLDRSLASQKDDLTNNLRSCYEVLAENYIKALSIENHIKIEQTTRKFISDSKTILDQQREHSEKSKKDANSTLDEIKKILAHARSINAEATISYHADIFETLSTGYSRQANFWVGAVTTTLIIGLIILYKIYANNFPHSVYTDEKYNLIQTLASRGLIFSLIAFAFSITTKNYRSNKHNEIINKHRSAALKTFGAFANSTEEQTIKNILLQQSANTIFSIQDSGYKESKEDDKASVLNIIKPSSPAP